MQRASRITMIAGGLLVATAWIVGTFDLQGRYSAVSDVSAEAVAILLFILAWRYRRNRLAMATLVIAAANFLIRTGRVPIPDGFTLTALALFVTIDLAIIAITRDRPILRPSGLVWPVVIAIQLWFVVIGVYFVSGRFAVLLERLGLVEGAFAAAGVLVIAAFVVRRGPFEGSLIWVLAACAAALIGQRGPASATLLFAAAELALLVGLIEDSYRLAFHDELTGLPGRRALDDAMRDLNGTFAIAMVDIDHFKRFNDRHGHDAGDQVLRMVSDNLAKTACGRAYRYGGEEFAIVFPGRGVSDIRDELETLRLSIADRKFALRAPDRPKTRPDKPKRKVIAAKRVTVTVSIGAANSNARRAAPSSVLKAADAALYRAKRAGRNRVVAAGDRLGKR